ncbi:putative SLC26A/SulP transporter [Lupinus albus]|uniref:Putative SLC26A/SulP transporter n=1 Tax=Lupinus albus TaxID=3870 RepID=A0A6A4PG47_LUPAL|nr:putative SLC26A/SulP transporter [Lupinus albus]
MEIHKVELPPHRSTLQKLKQRLSEIFLSDDPFYPFKNQTFRTKFILGLQYIFPIFLWAPQYNFRLLRSDIISGLTIASLAIPQVTTLILFSSNISFIYMQMLFTKLLFNANLKPLRVCKFIIPFSTFKITYVVGSNSLFHCPGCSSIGHSPIFISSFVKSFFCCLCLLLLRGGIHLLFENPHINNSILENPMV